MSIRPAKSIASANKKLTLVISIVFACIILTVGGYAFLAAPRYVVLDIEAPDSYLPRGDWTLTTFSTNKFLDTQSRYFVWRQRARVFTKAYDPRSPYDSWLSLKEYFDDRLADDEWTLYQNDFDDPCISFLPEAEFLPRGKVVIWSTENQEVLLMQKYPEYAWQSGHLGWRIRLSLDIMLSF